MQKKSIDFLYNTFIGRMFLKFLTHPFISKLGGFFLNTRFSSVFIKGFAKRNNIDFSIYEDKKYRSYNDFFTRKIKPNKRKMSKLKNDLVCPCDGNLSVYPIEEGSVFKIKNSIYRTEDLLEDVTLAKEYLGGYCLVFRLGVDNYHRYSYIDNGKILSHKKINGILHVVQEIAVLNHKAYVRNTRQYMVLDTNNFDKVIHIEVGALMVGKINNYHTSGYKFTKGEEKGYFEFGGSTIILLFKRGIINVDEKILNNSINHVEVPVKLGEVIGKRNLDGEKNK